MKYLIPAVGMASSCAIILNPENIYNHWAVTIWAAAIGGLTVQFFSQPEASR